MSALPAPRAPRHHAGVHWLDTLRNFVAGLMTRSDKMSYGAYVFRNRISQRELEAMYASNWLCRKVVDAPAEDMTREWINLETNNGDARETLEDAEREFSVVDIVTSVIKWGRLYGGCALYPSIEGDDPAMPLDVESIRPGTLNGLIVLDRWHIFPASNVPMIDLKNPNWRPEFYRIRGPNQQLIHNSRLLIMDGSQLPVTLLRLNQWWSDSVLQSLYDELQRNDTVAECTASMFFEACVDVLKIDQLRIQLASDEGTETLKKRFELAALMKSVNHALVLDAQDDYDKKINSFAGIPEVLRTFMERIAGATDIPATRLFGVAPRGMNATGESDMRNYYDAIKSKQEKTLRPVLELLYAILSMNAFGRLIDDLEISFKPLWQMNEKDAAQAGLWKAQRDEIYINRAVVTEAKVLQQLRADNTYPITDDDIRAAEEMANYMPPPQQGLPGVQSPPTGQPAANAGGAAGAAATAPATASAPVA
ncbi:DUF1073 domain-containing protein [Paraburkholderia sp. BR10936]|uniref:DUF1073 domain-containing protein n=1 Tax=Paraburkholderia sp. BR10936 TaxID=3236993 RepID=UPI0034D3883D